MSEQTSHQEAETVHLSESLLDRVLEAPCPSCAGKLQYDADHMMIACKYCGFKEDFDKANDRVNEQSLRDALDSYQTYTPSGTEKKSYECSSCGSKVMVDGETVYIRCSFCGSKNVNEEAFEKNYIQPSGVIPFAYSENKAQDVFKKWIAEGFFTPGKLKKLSFINAIKGVYIPFWTYDAQTNSHWSGYAGKYYYVTKTRYVNGKTESYQERRTEWIWREGVHSKFFDDVLVSSSKGVTQQAAQGIYPYDLKQVVNFNSKLLLGWQAEIYSIDVKNGYTTAEHIMAKTIEEECARMCSIDTYRDLHVRSQYTNQTFKHILLPLWICSYEFNGKTFRFMINGQTGKIEGSKPVDVVKVVLVVLAVLILIATLYFLFKK